MSTIMVVEEDGGRKRPLGDVLTEYAKEIRRLQDRISALEEILQKHALH